MLLLGLGVGLQVFQNLQIFFTFTPLQTHALSVQSISYLQSLGLNFPEL